MVSLPFHGKPVRKNLQINAGVVPDPYNYGREMNERSVWRVRGIMRNEMNGPTNFGSRHG
jgi:hypothetical protein